MCVNTAEVLLRTFGFGWQVESHSLTRKEGPIGAFLVSKWVSIPPCLRREASTNVSPSPAAPIQSSCIATSLSPFSALAF